MSGRSNPQSPAFSVSHKVLPHKVTFADGDGKVLRERVMPLVEEGSLKRGHKRAPEHEHGIGRDAVRVDMHQREMPDELNERLSGPEARC
jgi:hypothetical protein